MEKFNFRRFRLFPRPPFLLQPWLDSTGSNNFRHFKYQIARKSAIIQRACIFYWKFHRKMKSQTTWLREEKRSPINYRISWRVEVGFALSVFDLKAARFKCTYKIRIHLQILCTQSSLGPYFERFFKTNIRNVHLFAARKVGRKTLNLRKYWKYVKFHRIW